MEEGSSNNSDESAGENRESSDELSLGGKISLAGFRELDRSTMIVVKKIVGSYTRKIADIKGDDFEGLHVYLKKSHEKEKSEKYQINTKVLIRGTPFTSEVTDFNLFFALDSALKKVINSIKE